MNDHIKNEDEAAKEIRRLTDLLFRYDRAYYVEGKPEVSDREYDSLFQQLQGLEEQWPELKRPDSPTSRVGSDLSADFPEVEHTIPVLSLDKAYSTDELLSWMERTGVKAGRPLSFIVEEKIDGVSIVLYYEKGVLQRAVTRGNGYVGNDVTANIRTISSVPLRLSEEVDIAVRGEVFLPREKFGLLNRTMGNLYANPRNLAAGSLRRVKSREVAAVPLEIFIYEGFLDGREGEEGSHLQILNYLKELGFRTNPRVALFSAPISGEKGDDADGGASSLAGEKLEQITAWINDAVEGRASLPYEIDGLVIKVNEIDVRRDLGYTGHHPRWAIAYKFESPRGVTKIKDIDVQVGRTGRITPVARVEAVSIGGSTISNVTLHNQDYIDMLEIARGDEVAVSKRGDVIPAVEEVTAKNEEGNPVWKIPETCPSCATGLVKKGAHHFCRNSKCPDQIRGKLFFFIGAGQMDIDGLGPETVDLMIRESLITEPADLYQVDYHKLLEYPGFGEKKVRAIEAGIEKSRSRSFEVVLASVGIPEMGKKAVQLIVSAGFDSLDKLFDLAQRQDRDALIRIKGIGEKSADTILEELSRPEVRGLLTDLKKAGLSMEARKRDDSSDGIVLFSGQNWCITGSFDRFNPRSRAEALIERFGGTVVSAVSGKTSHLLAGAGGGSKLEKARKVGAQIVDEESFLNMLSQAGIMVNAEGELSSTGEESQ
jgi:DNA ligase (NAD+)